MVHIRSTFQVGTETFCLIDPTPLHRGKDRELMAMSCSRAASIADGREIWKMADTPTFFRWENDSATICYARDHDVPFISHCGDQGDINNQFINFFGNSIKSMANSKCIAIKKQQIE